MIVPHQYRGVPGGRPSRLNIARKQSPPPGFYRSDAQAPREVRTVASSRSSSDWRGAAACERERGTSLSPGSDVRRSESGSGEEPPPRSESGPGGFPARASSTWSSTPKGGPQQSLERVDGSGRSRSKIGGNLPQGSLPRDPSREPADGRFHLGSHRGQACRLLSYFDAGSFRPIRHVCRKFAQLCHLYTRPTSYVQRGHFSEGQSTGFPHWGQRTQTAGGMLPTAGLTAVAAAVRAGSSTCPDRDADPRLPRRHSSSQLVPRIKSPMPTAFQIISTPRLNPQFELLGVGVPT